MMRRLAIGWRILFLTTVISGIAQAEQGFPAGTVLAGAEPPRTEITDSPRTTVEVQANVFTAGAQEQAAVDASPDGRTLTVWASRRQESGSYGIYARSFDALGRALSEEIHVNRTERGAQHRPAVAMTSDGGAWVVWESTGQDGSGSAVVARRYQATPPAGRLVAIGGEIPVNVVRRGDQSSAAVASDSRGRALIVWSSSSPSGTTAIHGRRFDSGGRPIGGEIVLSRDARDDLPAVIGLPHDRFLVVWARRDSIDPSDPSGDESHSIRGRFVEAGGELLKDELELSPRGAAVAIEPAVAADAGGNFVLTWLTARRQGYAVAMRRFGARAEPLGEVRVIAEPSSGWKSGVAVATAPDGRFAVSYNSDGEDRDGEDGDGEGLYVQLFTADGRRSQIRRVNRATRGHQAATLASGARRAVWTAGDLLAFAWNGDSGHGDQGAANLTLLVPGGTEVAASGDPDRRQPKQRLVAETIASGEEAAIPPIWNPDFVPQARLPAGRRIGGDFGFEAIPGTGWTPPDPDLAVGPDRIVVIVNGAIAAFDKVGGEQWSDEIENAFGFWGELGADNFVFDPEVAFDPHSQRFFAMANEQSDDNRAYFLLAVSRDETPDDRDDWHKYRLDVTALANSGIDSPNLAMSRDHVLLTADFFGPDKYLIYVIDKSSILEGGTAVTTSELITGNGQQSMGIPVVTSDTATLYILQSTEFSSNDTVIIHAITDPFTDYQRQTFELSVPTYTYPANPPQQGTSSRPILFEPRFWSTAEHAGSIWAVHHVGNSRARVRWYQFDLGGWPNGLGPEGLGPEGLGTPSIVQSGELDLGESISTFFPSIQVDAAGNAAITFARSASNEYISIGRAVRAAADVANTFRPVQVVQTSTNPNTNSRWGDYSGTWADPVADNIFWGHHEFSGNTPGSWRTWVARYELLPEPMLLTVDPPVAGVQVTLEVTGATPGSTVFFYQTTEGTGLSEIPLLQVTLSLENAVEVISAVAGVDGIASVTTSLTPGAGVLVQAAESNRTTNWVETVEDLPIFADSFESGDTTFWSLVVP